MAANLEHRIRQLISPVPARVSKNFRSMKAGGEQRLRTSLEKHYFTRPTWGGAELSPEAYLKTEEGVNDMSQHVHERLSNFRSTVIPWLTHAVDLHEARVLEVGCGTGSSTIALAEQGAQVVAVDVDAPSTEVTRERCDVYQVPGGSAGREWDGTSARGG